MIVEELKLNTDYRQVFDGLQDFGKKWGYGLPWGAENNQHDGGPMKEVQAYRQANVVQQSDGRVTITGKKEKSGQWNYTAGMIQTFGKFEFQYGYVEAMLKVPGGSGVWPAFWLLPSSKNADGSFKWPPEIDIMEYVGKEKDVVQFNRFFLQPDGNASNTPIKWGQQGLEGTFHTYGVLWEPGKLIFFVDGIERAQMTNQVPSEPMYILLNLAFTANPDSWPGDVRLAKLPVQFDIGYVRVFQKKEATKPTVPPKDPATSADVIRINRTLSAFKKILKDEGY